MSETNRTPAARPQAGSDSVRNWRELRQFLLEILVLQVMVGVLVAPLAYAARGSAGVWTTQGMAFVATAYAFARGWPGQITQALLSAFAVGVLGLGARTNVEMSELGELWTAWTLGTTAATAFFAPQMLVGGFSEGFALGRLVPPRIANLLPRGDWRLWFAYASTIALVFFGVLRPQSFIDTFSWWTVAQLVAIAVGALGGATFCSIGALTMGSFLGLQARPGLLLLSRVWPYLQVMLLPVAVFSMTYVAIVSAFAGWYAFIERVASGASFQGVPAGWTPWDFVYFSLNTITTLGYSEMRPASDLTRGLVSAEVLMGIVWTLAVFAGFMAYITPVHGELARRFRRQSSASRRRPRRDPSPASDGPDVLEGYPRQPPPHT